MLIWNLIDGGWLTGRPRLVWAHFERRSWRHVPFKMTARARGRRQARAFVLVAKGIR